MGEELTEKEKIAGKELVKIVEEGKEETLEYKEGVRKERERIIKLIKRKFIHNIQFAENLIKDINRSKE